MARRSRDSGGHCGTRRPVDPTGRPGERGCGAPLALAGNAPLWDPRTRNPLRLSEDDDLPTLLAATRGGARNGVSLRGSLFPGRARGANRCIGGTHKWAVNASSFAEDGTCGGGEGSWDATTRSGEGMPVDATVLRSELRTRYGDPRDEAAVC